MADLAFAVYESATQRSHALDGNTRLGALRSTHAPIHAPVCPEPTRPASPGQTPRVQRGQTEVLAYELGQTDALENATEAIGGWLVERERDVARGARDIVYSALRAATSSYRVTRAMQDSKSIAR